MATYYDPSGRLIPGAGTYMEDQSRAQQAWERAMAQLKAQRSRRQIEAGLGEDYQVDPRAQYGTYQQMLQSQGGELEAASNLSYERGFRGRGLGNQGERALRYGHSVQNLGFQNRLMDWENEYQMGMTEAMRQKNEAMMAALRQAQEAAIGGGDWSGYSGDYEYIDEQGGSGPSTAARPAISLPRLVTPAVRQGSKIVPQPKKKQAKNPYAYRVVGRGGSY